LLAAAMVLVTIVYGDRRFEVAVIAIDWIVIIVGSVLLARWFRRGHDRSPNLPR
jgi:hypothetical protein